jgi:hypothetical protein
MSGLETHRSVRFVPCTPPTDRGYQASERCTTSDVQNVFPGFGSDGNMYIARCITHAHFCAEAMHISIKL